MARRGSPRRTPRRTRGPRRPSALHQPQLHPRRERHQRTGQRSQGGGRDQRTGPAVADDVGRLVGGEVRVDHRVVQAGSLQPERHLVGPVVVGQQHGDVVAGPQTAGEQGLRQPARTLLELCERHHLAGRGDDGRPVRVRGGVDPGTEAARRRGGLGAHRALLAQVAAVVPARRRRWPGVGRRPSVRSPERPFPTACRPAGPRRSAAGHLSHDPAPKVTTRTYCTILSTNYLPEVLALAESLRRHEAGAVAQDPLHRPPPARRAARAGRRVHPGPVEDRITAS